jgi:hypothetical protein
MKEGLLGWQAPACQQGATERRPEFNVACRFEAIWQMLTRNQSFAPAGAAKRVAA